MKRQRELRDKSWAIRKRGKLNSFPPLYRPVQATTPTASKTVGKKLCRALRKYFATSPGARFSKDPVNYRAR